MHETTFENVKVWRFYLKREIERENLLLMKKILSNSYLFDQYKFFMVFLMIKICFNSYFLCPLNVH